MRRSAPLAEPKRSETLDAVRAVALIGVLVVNMLVISGLRYLGTDSLDALQSTLDRAAYPAIATLVEGKALATFSMLFGLSFSLLMAGAARRGEPFAPFFARRLLVLAGLGLLNVTAFFWGDILLTYAAIGALLPLSARLSQRAVLGLALGLLAVPPVALALAGIGWPPPLGADEAQTLAAFAQGGFAATMEQNWALFTGAVGQASGLRIWRYTQIGGLFLLGLYVGRSGALGRIEAATEPLVRPALLVLAVAIPLEAAAAAGAIEGTARTAILWTKPAMGMAYALILARALSGAGGAALRGWLAPLGRMALTAYLMGGLLGQAVFYGWGLGRIGQAGTFEVLLWSLGIALVLGAFAHVWMWRFRYGPWEWLWRRLSRGGRTPMRLV